MRLLPGLTKKNLLFELLSGLTLLALAVPLNIGYAQIAGLPPIAGLYALIFPSIAFALLASTRQLIVSPDAAAGALVASSLAGLAIAGSEDYIMMALAQAIIGGLLFLICAFFKLGFLANFLSEPILVGFVGGLSIDIIVSQIAKMLGVPIDSSAEFVEKTRQLIAGLDQINVYAVIISAVSVFTLLAGQHYFRRIPWALIVLVFTTLIVVVFQLEEFGVGVLGAVQPGFPKLTWPQLSPMQWLQLVPSAAALTLVAMGEGLLVAKSYSKKRGYRINPNRDLFGFGMANIAAGLTGGFTVGSSTSRTAALDNSGSRTQLPALVAALLALLLVVFGTALLEHIPAPAIGSIVAVAMLKLIGVREFRMLWRVNRGEFLVGALCFGVTLFIGPIAGILVAFFASLLNLALRASRPPIHILATGDGAPVDVTEQQVEPFLTAPGVVIVRFAAPLFFANAMVFDDTLRAALEAAKTLDAQHVVLDCEAITDIDVTGSASLRSVREWVEENQLTLSYSRVRPDLLALLRHYDLLGDSRTFPSNRDAVAALRIDD